MGEELSLEFRLATSEDLREFVIPSWLQSYSRGLISKLCRADGRYSYGREVYWTAQRGRIDKILASPGSKVIVAYIDDVNVGWCCEDRQRRTLHYIYVKDAFRKQGIAKQLADWANSDVGGMVRITHLPPPWFSRPQEQKDGGPGKVLWKSHQVIDLISDF